MRGRRRRVRIAAVLSLLGAVGCASVSPPGPAMIPPRAPSCFELTPEYLLACADEPAPPWDEVTAASDAMQRAEPPSERSADLAPRAWSPEQARLAHLFHQTRCGMPRSDARWPTVVYRLARLYYDANQFSPAAVFFDEVASDPDAGELGSFAAMLAVDSLTVRVWRTTGAEQDDCVARFAPMIARYREAYCEPAPVDQDACAIFAQLAQTGPTLAPPAPHRRRGRHG